MLLRFIRRLLISLLLCATAWGAGYLWFVGQIPTASAADTQTTDAIVVLTGGKGRIDYGLTLLGAGRAKRLFISGVGEDATPEDVVKQSIHRAQITNSLSPDTVIILGYKASNTIGNALETSQWMQKEGFTSLRLVTASYHMPRSLEEFREVMPRITIIPDPVIPEHFHAQEWWSLRGSGHIMMSEYHKYIAARLRHALLEWSEEA